MRELTDSQKKRITSMEYNQVVIMGDHFVSCPMSRRLSNALLRIVPNAKIVERESVGLEVVLKKK